VGTIEEAGGTAEGIPVRCFGEPKELAALASFLLSDLSSFTNGEVVTFDGEEALAAGGQFNTLTQMLREQEQGLMEHVRPE
jgi:NAD(P)-dependent dehydrogenase (short-subunit alcohol dehydrogenase family)